MIYLYAITDLGARVPEVVGLDDAPLQLARGSAVAAIYSGHDRLDPSPQPETLWRHEQVVEAAMEAGPALPARFGTTFSDEQALGGALERDAPRLREQLERLRGCVELAVRVGLPEAPETHPANGRAYVEAKLAQQHRYEGVARDALAPLGELAMSARTQPSRSGGEEVCASYLIPRASVDRFVEEVRALVTEQPDLALSLTGPWPPYSFVELEPAL